MGEWASRRADRWRGAARRGTHSVLPLTLHAAPETGWCAVMPFNRLFIDTKKPICIKYQISSHACDGKCLMCLILCAIKSSPGVSLDIEPQLISGSNIQRQYPPMYCMSDPNTQPDTPLHSQPYTPPRFPTLICHARDKSRNIGPDGGRMDGLAGPPPASFPRHSARGGWRRRPGRIPGGASGRGPGVDI